MLSACYEYRLAANAAMLHARPVELTLTDSGAVVLASRIGPGVEAIRGTFLGDSAGAYLIAITAARQRSGVETDWRGEQVAVPHALASALFERKFSSSRTALAGVLAAIGVGGMTTALRGRGESPGSIPVVTPPTGK